MALLYAISIEEGYTDPTSYVIPAVLSKSLPPNEEYITHATFKKIKKNAEREKEKTFVYVLARTNYYKLDAESYQKIWCKSVSDIVSVLEDHENPNKLKMVYLFFCCYTLVFSLYLVLFI